MLVTHQHHFAVNSRCIVMSNGAIVCSGSYQECAAASKGLSLTSPTVNNPEEVEDEEPEVNTDITSVNMKEESESSSITRKEENDTEVSASGVVKMETFKNYMKAMPGGLSACLLLLLVFCVAQGSSLAALAFIGKWPDLPANQQLSPSVIGPVFALVIAVGASALIRAVLYFHLTVEASKRLHDDMLKSVIRAKLEFFDTNPLGRILNRFASDVGVTDDQLPVALFDFLVILFMVIGALTSALSILPLIAVFLPPLVGYFLRVRGVFLKTSRELKRIEGMARSPIFSCLNESLSGIETLRSNNVIGCVQEKFKKVHDSHTRSFFAFIACERWLGFRMVSCPFVRDFIQMILCD